MKKRIGLLAVAVLLAMSVFAFAACSDGTKTESYTVTFNSNGGSAVSPITQDEGAQIAKPTPDPKKDGSVFKGWYYDAALSQAVTFPFTLDKDYTLNARWATTVVPDDLFDNVIADDEPYVALTEDTGTAISEKAIAAIKESTTPVKIELPSGLVLSIDPATITEDVQELDLNIDVTATTDEMTTTEGIVIPANSIYIAPAAHGDFGLAVSFVKTKEELAAAGIDSTEGLKLWYIADDGTVSNKGTLTKGEDGSVTVTISSASSYALSRTKPYTVPVWDFSDLDNLGVEISPGNFTVTLTGMMTDGWEQIYRITDKTVTEAYELNGEQVGMMYVYIQDGDTYYKYYTPYKLIGAYDYENLTGEIITKEDYDRNRSKFVEAIPLMTDNDYYDYDAVTQTHTLKAEYIETICSLTWMQTANSITITRTNGRVNISFHYDEYTAEILLWDVGTTPYPETPVTTLPEKFDDAVAVTLGTPVELQSLGKGGENLFKFTPATSGEYVIYPSMKYSFVSMAVYDKDGIKQLGRQEIEGDKSGKYSEFVSYTYQMQAGADYYISASYDMLDWDVSLIVDTAINIQPQTEEKYLFFGRVPTNYDIGDNNSWSWSFDIKDRQAVLDTIEGLGYVVSRFSSEESDSEPYLNVSYYDNDGNGNMIFSLNIFEQNGTLTCLIYEPSEGFVLSSGTLTWPEVTNAAKYQLYVYDAEQVQVFNKSYSTATADLTEANLTEGGYFVNVSAYDSEDNYLKNLNCFIVVDGDGGITFYTP